MALILAVGRRNVVDALRGLEAAAWHAAYYKLPDPAIIRKSLLLQCDIVEGTTKTVVYATVENTGKEKEAARRRFITYLENLSMSARKDLRLLFAAWFPAADYHRLFFFAGGRATAHCYGRCAGLRHCWLGRRGRYCT